MTRTAAGSTTCCGSSDSGPARATASRRGWTMNNLRIGLLLLLLALSAWAQTETKEPASQVAYKTLLGEYNSALAAFQKALAQAKTSEEKQKVFRDSHPSVARYA